MFGYIDIYMAKITYEMKLAEQIKRIEKLKKSLKLTHDLMAKINGILMPTLDKNMSLVSLTL